MLIHGDLGQSLVKELTVFFVSDHTGVTAEVVGKSLLSQFSGQTCKTLTVPFIDTPEKARELAARVHAAKPAMIISTLTNDDVRAALKECGAPVFDVFDAFSAPIAAVIGTPPVASHGQTHGMNNRYDLRMEAVNFALALDDGLHPEKLAEAELILVGVSRAGKTPVALYLAMQHSMKAANYPLTPDDLAATNLAALDIPAPLKPHLAKLRGLTLSPERLASIRQARYPNSRYASIEQCREELASVAELFRRHAIPVIDSTRMSVEEIAARLRHL